MHLKDKHVNIRSKFICHRAQEGSVVPRSVKSKEMMSEILTKALSAPKKKEVREMLKLKSTRDDTEEKC